MYTIYASYKLQNKNWCNKCIQLSSLCNNCRTLYSPWCIKLFLLCMQWPIMRYFLCTTSCVGLYSLICYTSITLYIVNTKTIIHKLNHLLYMYHNTTNNTTVKQTSNSETKRVLLGSLFSSFNTFTRSPNEFCLP